MSLGTIMLQSVGGIPQEIVMLALVAIVFYFFMIRPQLRRSKEAKKFREGLSKGDKVVTVGGIHGKISDIKEDTVILEVESGTKLKVARTAVRAEFVPPAN